MNIKNEKDRLILVTNDDGYNAPGVHALAQTMAKFGKVVCVCPATQESGQSMALTLTKPLTFRKAEIGGDIDMYEVNGTPVDCVALAISVVLGRKPDLIASGINLGSNASVNMLFSGTMGAASMGCLFGVPSIGFSLDSMDPNASFDNCLPFVDKITRYVLHKGLPDGVCLNVNIPSQEVAPSQMRLTTLCKATWKADYTPVILSSNTTDEEKSVINKPTKPASSQLQKDETIAYQPNGSFINEDPDNPHTDLWCLAHNIVSITPVQLNRTFPTPTTPKHS